MQGLPFLNCRDNRAPLAQWRQRCPETLGQILSKAGERSLHFLTFSAFLNGAPDAHSFGASACHCNHFAYILHTTMDCLRSFCMVKSRGLAHLAALGPVSLILRCVIVKTVKLVGIMGLRKTGCTLERQDQCCTYLAHHELINV